MRLELEHLYYYPNDEAILKVAGIVERPNEIGEEIVSFYQADVIIGEMTFGERSVSFTPESSGSKKLIAIPTLPDKLKKKVIKL